MSMLREHVEKGDMRDIANIAMMVYLHNLLVFARSDDAIRPFLAQLRQGMTKGAIETFI